MSIAGIDIGTTGCKMTIYSDQGEYCYRAYRDYPALRSAGEHEVHAEAIWEGVQAVIREGTSKYPDVHAIGITSFGESCVLLDEKDQPIRPVMLYTDPRGTKECERLVEELGADQIADITGLAPHSMYSLPKIMWIKEHCPEEYRRTKRIMMMEDYVAYCLTGNACIDYSLASRSMAFDIHELCWSKKMFEVAQIDERLFSTPVVGGSVVGTIRGELASELEIGPQTKIVVVGHDQVAAAIGSGAFAKGCGVDGAGTVECITPVYEGIPTHGAIREGKYAVVPYVMPGTYVTYAFGYTGGALIEWYISHMCKAEKELAKKTGQNVYDLLEKEMKSGPTGILVMPHFAGAATPYMDIGSKGAILGLTIEHNTSDLYRAMMEGVVYEMCINMEYLQKGNIAPTYLRATGGGASSQVWMQMKADMLNMPITSLQSKEAGAAGCAMAAGIAAGIFENWQDAASYLVKEKRVYEPRMEQHEQYMEWYAKYRQVYQAVRPLM